MIYTLVDYITVSYKFDHLVKISIISILINIDMIN